MKRLLSTHALSLLAVWAWAQKSVAVQSPDGQVSVNITFSPPTFSL